MGRLACTGGSATAPAFTFKNALGAGLFYSGGLVQVAVESTAQMSLNSASELSLLQTGGRFVAKVNPTTALPDCSYRLERASGAVYDTGLFASWSYMSETDRAAIGIKLDGMERFTIIADESAPYQTAMCFGAGADFAGYMGPAMYSNMPTADGGGSNTYDYGAALLIRTLASENDSKVRAGFYSGCYPMGTVNIPTLTWRQGTTWSDVCTSMVMFGDTRGIELGAYYDPSHAVNGEDVQGNADLFSKVRIMPDKIILGSSAGSLTDPSQLEVTPYGVFVGDTSLVVPQREYDTLLTNGNMNSAQRATSVTGASTAGQHVVDCIHHAITGMGTWTISQENVSIPGYPFKKSLKMLCTTAQASPGAAAEFSVLMRAYGERCQGLMFGTAQAKYLFLSFWVRSSTTGTYVAELYSIDQTRHCNFQYTISQANTWERKTIMIPGDTVAGFDNDRNLSLQLEFWMGGGSNYTSGSIQNTWAAVVAANRAPGQVNLAASVNNYMEITGVALRPSKLDLPYLWKAPAQDLEESEEFVQVFDGNGSVVGLPFTGIFYSATGGFGNLLLRRRMRAMPGASLSGNIYAEDGVAGIQSATISRTASRSSDRVANLDVSGLSGYTAKTPFFLRFNDSSSKLILSADM